MPTLNVNGKDPPHRCQTDHPILGALRDMLGLSGSKFGCGAALCGAGAVHLDGAADWSAGCACCALQLRRSSVCGPVCARG